MKLAEYRKAEHKENGKKRISGGLQNMFTEGFLEAPKIFSLKD